MKLATIAFITTLVAFFIGVEVEKNYKQKLRQPVDSLIFCRVDCLECVETNRKKVNILNKHGHIIASYYDVIFKEDTTLLNHSKIPEDVILPEKTEEK